MKSALLLLPIAMIIGCSSPNKANIELRKQNQQLRDEVESLKRQHAGDAATISSLESRGTTVPSLPQTQIDKMFTVHGLKFGRLTGADPKGVKVYVVPTDGAGQPIKAAGSFVIDAFDLAAGDNVRVAHCEHPLEQAEKNWYGQGMLYTYALECAWQTPPKHAEITVKVQFTDALTGRTFSEQKVLKVAASAQ